MDAAYLHQLRVIPCFSCILFSEKNNKIVFQKAKFYYRDVLRDSSANQMASVALTAQITDHRMALVIICSAPMATIVYTATFAAISYNVVFVCAFIFPNCSYFPKSQLFFIFPSLHTGHPFPSLQ